MSQLYNVVAINIETKARRIIWENITERNAEAIVNLCVMRLGVETEFYTTEPSEETLWGNVSNG